VIAEWLAVCAGMLVPCAHEAIPHDAPANDTPANDTAANAGRTAMPMRAENQTANLVLELRRRAALRTAPAKAAISVPSIKQFTI